MLQVIYFFKTEINKYTKINKVLLFRYLVQHLASDHSLDEVFDYLLDILIFQMYYCQLFQPVDDVVSFWEEVLFYPNLILRSTCTVQIVSVTEVLKQRCY